MFRNFCHVITVGWKKNQYVIMWIALMVRGIFNWGRAGGHGGHCKWKSVIYPYFLHILKFHFDHYWTLLSYFRTIAFSDIGTGKLFWSMVAWNVKAWIRKKNCRTSDVPLDVLAISEVIWYSVWICYYVNWRQVVSYFICFYVSSSDDAESDGLYK